MKLAEKILNHFKESKYQWPQDRVVENIKKIIQEDSYTKVVPKRNKTRDNNLESQIRMYERSVAAEPDMINRKILKTNFDNWRVERGYTNSDIMYVMKEMEYKR